MSVASDTLSHHSLIPSTPQGSWRTRGTRRSHGVQGPRYGCQTAVPVGCGKEFTRLEAWAQALRQVRYSLCPAPGQWRQTRLSMRKAPDRLRFAEFQR